MPRSPALYATLRLKNAINVFRAPSNGRPHRLRIGAFGDVTIEQASDKARKWIANQVDGEDIAALKRKKRENPTVADHFDHWLAHAKQHKKTWAADEKKFNFHFGPIRNKRLVELTTADVARWHAKIGTKLGADTAN